MPTKYNAPHPLLWQLIAKNSIRNDSYCSECEVFIFSVHETGITKTTKIGWYLIYINLSVSPYFGVSILVTTGLITKKWKQKDGARCITKQF